MNESSREDSTPAKPRTRKERFLSIDIAELWDDPVEMTLPAMGFGGLWWTPMSTNLLKQFCVNPILIMLDPETPVRILDCKEIAFIAQWWSVVFIPTPLAKEMLHIIALGADSGEMLAKLTRTVEAITKEQKASRFPVPEPAGYT